MLGQLYHPRGLALETAKAVLEVNRPMACNVAKGCPNDCMDCYGPLAAKKKNWTTVEYPRGVTDKNPNKLLLVQVPKMIEKFHRPQGVFFSFLTDPFHEKVVRRTDRNIRFLHELGIPTATLTKLSFTEMVFKVGMNRSGKTIVSLDSTFCRKVWEPNALRPFQRIRDSEVSAAFGDFTWFSAEPRLPPAVHKQNLVEMLEEMKFAKFIIYGKLNYDKRANTDLANDFYYADILTFRDWCMSNKIRWHVKSETLKFVGLLHNQYFQGHGGQL